MLAARIAGKGRLITKGNDGRDYRRQAFAHPACQFAGDHSVGIERQMGPMLLSDRTDGDIQDAAAIEARLGLELGQLLQPDARHRGAIRPGSCEAAAAFNSSASTSTRDMAAPLISCLPAFSKFTVMRWPMTDWIWPMPQSASAGWRTKAPGTRRSVMSWLACENRPNNGNIV
jgi:hypothetical protein